MVYVAKIDIRCEKGVQGEKNNKGIVEIITQIAITYRVDDD